MLIKLTSYQLFSVVKTFVSLQALSNATRLQQLANTKLCNKLAYASMVG